MTDDDFDAEVDAFLRKAESVFSEYDKGYMNADVALDRLRKNIEDLEEATE